MAGPTLVVMAAGLGSRYGGLKQTDPMGPTGETLLEYSVFDALRAGFGRVVFVIKPEFDKEFRRDISAKFDRVVEVNHVFQELTGGVDGHILPSRRVKPWGTGHALLSAADAIDGPFAAVNADDFYGLGSFQVIADYLSAGADSVASEAALVGYALRDTMSPHGHVARAICEVDDAMLLQGVTERTEIRQEGDQILFEGDDGKRHVFTGDEVVSMNMWGFRPSFLDHLRTSFAQFLDERGGDPEAEFLIPDVVNGLIGSGILRVRVLPSSGVWFGVTYREDKPATRRHLQKLTASGVYPEELWRR